MDDRTTCRIQDCGKPVFVKARGWCSAHYARWRKHGDPTISLYGHPPNPCAIDGCTAPGNAGRGWCQKHYRRYQRHGDPLATSRIVGDDAARFASYITEGPSPAHAPDLGPCWLWTGLVNVDGYAVMRVVGRVTHSGHGWSYEHHVGPIPAGLEHDHLCRVRRCVNPWHLDPVPHLINIQRANALRATA